MSSFLTIVVNNINLDCRCITSELSSKFQKETCFFGERHGENESDAVGGVVKSFLSHFAACERASLATANKIVDFLSSTFELTHKSTMLLGE